MNGLRKYNDIIASPIGLVSAPITYIVSTTITNLIKTIKMSEYRTHIDSFAFE